MMPSTLSLLLVLAAATSTPTVEELPFPLESTTLKTDGASYYVAGRVRLPSNVTVTSLREMTLTGRGDHPVLEVSGKLEIKAATGGRIRIDNLTIEVMPDCKDLLITQASLSSGGIVSSPEGPCQGEIYLADLVLDGSAKIELNMNGGQIDLQNSRVATPVRIQGIDASEKNRAKLKVLLLNNKSSQGGLTGGLFLENAWDALVRNCDIGGELSKIENCRQLDFDGNHMRSSRFEVLQKDPKDFEKTRIANTDFTTPETRIFAPGDPDKPDKLERMTLQGGWFHDSVDSDEIREKYLIDSGREPGNGMLIVLKRTTPRRRGLGG